MGAGYSVTHQSPGEWQDSLLACLLDFDQGRDRAEARALVIQTKSRFLGPPCNPGRSDFPIPVLTLAFPVRSFRVRWSLSARSHTPQPKSVYLATRPEIHGSSDLHR